MASRSSWLLRPAILVCVVALSACGTAPFSVGPSVSAASPGPLSSAGLEPRVGLVYWRAPCPMAPCEVQVPPTTDEGKGFETNNYYLGYDGTSAWAVYAGRTTVDGRGALRLVRKDGLHEIALPIDRGVPTLTAVASGQARFVTTSGHEGYLDLVALLLTFSRQP